MGLKQLLIERIVHDNVDEARDYLIRNGIDLDDTNLDYYIGSGSYGDVYKVKDKNKVVKFFDDASGEEVKKYEELEKEENLQYVCNVYFVRKVSDNSNIHIAVLDYLKTHGLFEGKHVRREFSAFISHLEPTYLNIIEGHGSLQKYVSSKSKILIKEFVRIYTQVDDLNTKDDAINLLKELGEPFDDTDLIYLFIYILYEYTLMYESGNTMITEMVVKYITKNSDLLKDIFEGIKEYKEMGIEHGDIHLGNILWDDKKKNYKLIDPI